MSPTYCPLRGNKWIIYGGGLCQIYRTLDRLAAISRGPEVPAANPQLAWGTSRRGELFRGVAPNPVQPAREVKAEETPPGSSAGPVATTPVQPEVPQATTPKVPPPPPPAFVPKEG